MKNIKNVVEELDKLINQKNVIVKNNLKSLNPDPSMGFRVGEIAGLCIARDRINELIKE